MRSDRLLSWWAAAAVLLVLARCSSPPDPSSPSPSPAPARPAADATPQAGGDASPGTVDQEPAAVAEPAPASAAHPPAEVPVEDGAPPAAASPPPAPATSPATAGAPPAAMADPGGVIQVAATVEGLTEIGAAKCRPCHKVQFDSWSETAHAKRTPPLECESCHGPGSGYKGLAVMKDPEKARAAGLVIPDAAFCARCHRTWSDDMLAKAHLHKPPAS